MYLREANMVQDMDLRIPYQFWQILSAQDKTKSVPRDFFKRISTEIRND